MCYYMFLFCRAETVPIRTVNRQCSSGLQAVADVAAAIKAGFYDVGRFTFLVTNIEHFAAVENFEKWAWPFLCFMQALQLG